MKQVLVFAALFAAAAGWIACSPSSGAAAKTPTDGGVEAPAAAAGPASDSPGAVTVRYWVAGCSVAEDLWKYRKSSTITCDARGRTLASAHGVMRWPDYIAASGLDTVIVEGDGLDGLRFELAWSADDTFVPGTSVPGHSVEQAGDAGGSRQVRFVLKGAPGWQGMIRRFRLTWDGEPSSPASRIVGAWGKKASNGG